MSDKEIHVCHHMKDGYGHDNPCPYSFRWAEVHGWCLYTNDEPRADYRWYSSCDWCSTRFPIINDPIFEEAKTNVLKLHRCINMVQTEWSRKRGDMDCYYLVEWDGFEWIHTNYGVVSARYLKVCPYCNEALPNPRSFINKVEIA